MNDGFLIEIFLQPGEAYFGDAPERIRTLLGSCVAVTMWHPVLCRGGMIHCLLPGRGARALRSVLDPRFVDEGIAWLLRESCRHGVDPRQCEFKLFGGANMLSGHAPAGTSRIPIGTTNAARAIEVLEGIGVTVKARDLGGCGHRTLFLDLGSGYAWVRRGGADPGKSSEQGALA